MTTQVTEQSAANEVAFSPEELARVEAEFQAAATKDYEARRTRVTQINAGIRQLPLDKLNTVFDFVADLVKQQQPSESLQLTIASEAALAKDWNTSEEDEAWADL